MFKLLWVAVVTILHVLKQSLKVPKDSLNLVLAFWFHMALSVEEDPTLQQSLMKI